MSVRERETVVIWSNPVIVWTVRHSGVTWKSDWCFSGHCCHLYSSKQGVIEECYAWRWCRSGHYFAASRWYANFLFYKVQETLTFFETFIWFACIGFFLFLVKRQFFFVVVTMLDAGGRPTSWFIVTQTAWLTIRRLSLLENWKDRLGRVARLTCRGTVFH